MVALAVDVKTVQTRVGHCRATTTLDIYAQPTAKADRGAAEVLGHHFLGSRAIAFIRAPSRALRAMNARWTSSQGTSAHPDEDEESAPEVHQDFSGASWNRTSDLSIISAAL